MRLYPILHNTGVAVIALVLTSASWAAASGVGLITQLKGPVKLSTAEGEISPPLFAKLDEGTTVDVGADGMFQLVYLGSGRQETWGANTKLVVGEKSSKPLKATRFPAIKNLPPLILQGLDKAPVVVANLRSRQGMIRVRAVEDWQTLETVQANYTSLREQAKDDDVTPELFLLASLSEMKLYDKMQEPLDEMIKRRPDDASIQALHAAYLETLKAGAAQ